MRAEVCAPASDAEQRRMAPSAERERMEKGTTAELRLGGMGESGRVDRARLDGSARRKALSVRSTPRAAPPFGRPVTIPDQVQNNLGHSYVVDPEIGTEPVWSNSGEEIIYRAADPASIASVAFSATPTVSLGAPRILFPSRDCVGCMVVAHDDSRVLMMRRAGGAGALERLTIVENWVEELRRSKR